MIENSSEQHKKQWNLKYREDAINWKTITW